MAQIETLGILQDIESLVSDQLQVVSYKWLSRNYLLSSNSAKSLLEQFVEKHAKGLEVVYALSGWLKSSSSSYHIRLVAGPKLEEAKQEFDGECSVQVYSVQSCIPKDPAVLWNVEFVQAEELFKQPSTIDNCLRDNRFCGISNSFIKRTVEGSSLSVSTPQIQSGLGLGPSKCSFSGQKTSVPQTLQQKGEQTNSKIVVPTPNVVKDVKIETNSTGIQDEASKPSTNKEKTNSLPANKKKVQNGKSSSGTEGSLANFWNRASAKSKASVPAEASTGASADALICAREAENIEDIMSDDDGQDMNFKRSSNGEGTRKRRVVLDYSDDDEYGDAVNLSSPEKGQSGQYMEESIKSLVPKKSDPNVDKRVEDKPKDKKKGAGDKWFNQPTKKDSLAVITNDEIKETSPKEKTHSINDKSKETSPKEKAHSINDKNKETLPKEKALSTVPESDTDKKDKLTKTSPDSPKRRKVMKTRIDERGREVTEVVWEGEEKEAKKPNAATSEKADNGTTKKAENSTSTKDNSRPPVTKRSPALGNTGASNPTGKAGNKKTGIKDPKQGNILSFFKKV